MRELEGKKLLKSLPQFWNSFASGIDRTTAEENRTNKYSVGLSQMFLLLRKNSFQ